MVAARDRARRASCPATTWRWRWIPQAPSSTATTPTTWRAWHVSSDEMVAYWADLLERFPIVSLEDRTCPGRLERLGRAHPGGRRPGAAGGGRSVRHQHRASRTRHPRGRRQLDPDQGQSDRHADRDAGCHRSGNAQRVHQRREPSQRRDRGHHDRRPGRGDQRRPDQDRRPPAAASEPPSTTSCCGSKRSWGSKPATADLLSGLASGRREPGRP